MTRNTVILSALIGFAVATPAAGANDLALQIGASPETPLLAVATPAVDRAHFVVLAYAGQLSRKDNCHRHRAVGERHWHIDGGVERGGPCVRAPDGRTWSFDSHTLCLEARLDYAEDQQMRPVDYARHAEALKSCIVALPPLRGGEGKR